MMNVICGSSDAGAINYFKCLKKHINLKIVDNFDQIELQENAIYLTGAALGDSLDKKIIKKAAIDRKKCVSVIDHWSWYKKRFECKEGLLLPDIILVNDEIAFSDAIKDGLPENILRIGGNPVLEELNEKQHNFDVDISQLKNNHSLPNKRIVVFVSENLATEFNNSNDDLGYDEFRVIDEIIELLKPSDHLVIKLHPSEKLDKYDYLEGVKYTPIKNIDIFELEAIADIVIGMASMLLLELAMLRNDIISFRPNNNKKFIGKRLDATIDISTQQELKKVLIEPRVVPTDFRQRFDGSGSRIAKIINDFVQ